MDSILIKQFIDHFLDQEEEKQIEMIEQSSFVFLSEVKSYCIANEKVNLLQMIEKTKDIIIEKKYLFTNSEENKTKLLKEEISKEIHKLDERNYEISEQDKEIVNEFFKKTRYSVINNLLQAIFTRIKNSNRTEYQKRHFLVSTCAITFKSEHYSQDIIYYLEDKYRDFIKELGLDEVGIDNVSLIKAQYRSENDFYFIDYENNKYSQKFKYSIYTYNVAFNCNLKKEKTYFKK